MAALSINIHGVALCFYFQSTAAAEDCMQKKLVKRTFPSTEYQLKLVSAFTPRLNNSMYNAKMNAHCPFLPQVKCFCFYLSAELFDFIG